LRLSYWISTANSSNKRYFSPRRVALILRRFPRRFPAAIIDWNAIIDWAFLHSPPDDFRKNRLLEHSGKTATSFSDLACFAPLEEIEFAINLRLDLSSPSKLGQ
jgi:hypothetical protein